MPIYTSIKLFCYFHKFTSENEDANFDYRLTRIVYFLCLYKNSFAPYRIILAISNFCFLHCYRLSVKYTLAITLQYIVQDYYQRNISRSMSFLGIECNLLKINLIIAYRYYVLVSILKLRTNIGKKYVFFLIFSFLHLHWSRMNPFEIPNKIVYMFTHFKRKHKVTKQKLHKYIYICIIFTLYKNTKNSR